MLFFPSQNTLRQWIILTRKRRQHTINGKVLMLQTDSRQLIVRMRNLFQR